MTRHSFFCIDAHTCGNPVRVVTGGGPRLTGATMSEMRQDFLKHHDWVRRALMFEPRGHDMMSGSILYPPLNPDSDMAVLFIETSGCLPMCGHGTIGTVTAALEQGQVVPKVPGQLTLDVPAGTIRITYTQTGDYVDKVRLHNVASYLAHREVRIKCPDFGELVFDIAYGGNYYAILDPQKNFSGLEDISAADVVRYSPVIRDLLNEKVVCVHPEDPTVNGVSHVLWTGKPTKTTSHARNAVFYGEKAIDRSPCGTGTSARMAQWVTNGTLNVGDDFIHESIIGSHFEGRVEAHATVGDHDAILPSIQGWAKVTGFNTIIVDDRDPYAHGFTVT